MTLQPKHVNCFPPSYTTPPHSQIYPQWPVMAPRIAQHREGSWINKLGWVREMERVDLGHACHFMWGWNEGDNVAFCATGGTTAWLKSTPVICRTTMVSWSGSSFSGPGPFKVMLFINETLILNECSIKIACFRANAQGLFLRKYQAPMKTWS